MVYVVLLLLLVHAIARNNVIDTLDKGGGLDRGAYIITNSVVAVREGAREEVVEAAATGQDKSGNSARNTESKK